MGTFGRSVALLSLSAAGVLASGTTACSSKSSSSPDSGPSFSFDGGGDTGVGSKDSGSKDAKSVGAKETGGPTNRSCGAPSGTPDWCSANTPSLSPVLCDDFDQDDLSNLYTWVGVTLSDLVDTHYSSPFCALNAVAMPGDGGTGNGAYTEQPFTLVNGSGGATLAFDLFVPGGAACNGAVVGRVIGSAITSSMGELDAIKGWITLSDITGTGASATSYTAGLTVGVSATGTPSAPVTLTVSPRTSDEGWVRIDLDLSSFTVQSNPAALSGTLAWYYRDDKTVVATSKAVSGSGTLVATAQNGVFVFDVGIIPDPTTKQLPAGCQLYVDNVVTGFSK
jgi:hypothetical protein